MFYQLAYMIIWKMCRKYVNLVPTNVTYWFFFLNDITIYILTKLFYTPSLKSWSKYMSNNFRFSSLSRNLSAHAFWSSCVWMLIHVKCTRIETSEIFPFRNVWTISNLYLGTKNVAATWKSFFFFLRPLHLPSNPTIAGRCKTI